LFVSSHYVNKYNFYLNNVHYVNKYNFYLNNVLVNVEININED